MRIRIMVTAFMAITLQLIALTTAAGELRHKGNGDYRVTDDRGYPVKELRQDKTKPPGTRYWIVDPKTGKREGSITRKAGSSKK